MPALAFVVLNSMKRFRLCARTVWTGMPRVARRWPDPSTISAPPRIRVSSAKITTLLGWSLVP